VAAEDALGADTDILVPAAREDVIDERIAQETTAQLVVEGANLPTTKLGLEVLFQRGVPVVPDFIANAGGIVAAAHSMDARTSPFRVDASKVLDMISSKIRSNAAAVHKTSVDSSIP